MRARDIVIAAVLVAAFLSGACSRSVGDGIATGPTPPSPGGNLPVTEGCDHTKAQAAIGQPASDTVREQARIAAGAQVARFLRPNDIITLEFLATRLNLVLDAKDVVQSMYCG